MKKGGLLILAAGILSSAAILYNPPMLWADDDDDDDIEFRAKLNGFQENPSLSTAGKGSFKAELSEDGTQLDYVLRYENLPSGVVQAHIHLGASRTNGGVMVFLCENTGSTGGAAPMCPADGAVSGTLDASSVIGPTSQGIEAGEFEEFIRALKAGAGYVNVHTTEFPSGEIRGQVRKDDD